MKENDFFDLNNYNTKPVPKFTDMSKTCRQDDSAYSRDMFCLLMKSKALSSLSSFSS